MRERSCCTSHGAVRRPRARVIGRGLSNFDSNHPPTTPTGELSSLHHVAVLGGGRCSGETEMKFMCSTAISAAHVGGRASPLPNKVDFQFCQPANQHSNVVS